MANTPDYSWPPKEQRKVIGQPVKRLDGPVKATGRARYASDTKVGGMLYGAYVACPHAHAKVTSVDTGEAEKMPGVKAVHLMAPAGTEIQWQGWEVAAVAALTELQARDAARKIKVAYEAMPHLVQLRSDKDGQLSIVAAEPGKYELKMADGKSRLAEISAVPAPVEIVGAWDVSFPPKWGAPEKITVDKLTSLSESTNAGVKYFSGTATRSEERR